MRYRLDVSRVNLATNGVRTYGNPMANHISKKTKNQSQATTQQDIAKIVGCSQNTVALALKDSPRISQAKREEIRRVADEHGYHPFFAARGLRQGRSGLIGMFGTLDPIRSDYVQNVMNKLHDTEYKPILGIDFDQFQPWYESKWVGTLLSLQVEALICFAGSDDPVLPPWHTRVPIVMCGFTLDKDKPLPACDTIAMDRFRGVALGINHLVGQGHRQIVSVERHHSHRISEGYLRAMKKHQLKPNVIARRKEVKSQVFVEQFAAEYKAGKIKASAVFVLNTGLAVELYFALTRAGIRVPEDLEIVAYDRAPWIEHLSVPITTVEQPVEEMTASSISVVLSRLGEPDQPHMHIEHDLKLIVRR